MPDRTWDIGDPEPDGVIAVRDYTYAPHDHEFNAHWGRTTNGEWKGYKDGNGIYLDWVELVRRWGPVTAAAEVDG